MKGTIVHEYELIRLLGEGTFGQVWEAWAPGKRQRAAVKIIRKRAPRQLEARLELKALEALGRLNHPHLLPTFGCWDDPDRVVIAMELADGTLRQRLRDCQAQGMMGIPPEELIHYLRESAEALDYLHEQGYLHRDVKPDNILMFTSGSPPHVKLGDCGLLR